MNHTEYITVYPEDCNYMMVEGSPMIHGGSLLMKMDRAAANCIRLFMLRKTTCNESRTVNVTDVNFYSPAKLGDILKLECRIINIGIKSITVTVEVKYTNNNLMAEGTFKFVTFTDGVVSKHGIKNV